ncbi:MAG: hypothetical protein ACTSSA_11045 [Candidatus Freyarchaeota archaeon]
MAETKTNRIVEGEVQSEGGKTRRIRGSGAESEKSSSQIAGMRILATLTEAGDSEEEP